MTSPLNKRVGGHDHKFGLPGSVEISYQGLVLYWPTHHPAHWQLREWLRFPLWDGAWDYLGAG